MIETGFVPLGDTRIHYQAAGEGPALLFLHAGIADSRMWRDQMRLEGHRTIVFDQRGFGRTDWVPGPYANRTDALAVLDHLGVDQAVVVGCSNGAEAALQMAITAPERVSGLVLVGAAARGWEPEGGWPEEPFWDEIVAALEAGDIEAVVDFETRLWLAGPTRSLEDIDVELVALCKEMDTIPQDSERERNGHVQTLEPPTNDQLDHIEAATLVMVGEHDLGVLLESAQYLARRLGGASPIVLEGTAHLPSLDQPEEFNRILRQFLATL
jgi:pimeloyl-ACP methyl ester carboxylesterase